MKMDLIIPFHGKTEMLKRCLESVFGQRCIYELNIYLVNDGSFGRAMPKRGNLKVINLAERKGFVNAVNSAWAQSAAEIAIVLNSDTVLSPDILDALKTVLLTHKRIAAVAPASDNPHDLFQFEMQSTGLFRYANYLTGMCLAIRRSAITREWLFDPAYSPGYFEDFDLSCHLRTKGWKLAILNSAPVHHEGAATFSDWPQREAVIERNYQRFTHRWGSLPSHKELDSMLSIPIV